MGCKAVQDVVETAELSARQQDVLDATLALMVEEGDRITMTAVARRASCSKETLYKWFGGREGLLTATVRWQASRVRVAPVDRCRIDLASLTASLEQFAANWLTVISSDSSIALNRLAASHAGSGRTNLGAIMLENGRFAMGRRLKPVLEAGRDAGLLRFDDGEMVFRTFFGLVARDVQIRLLFGEKLTMTAAQINRDAALATRQLLTLFQADDEPANAGSR